MIGATVFLVAFPWTFGIGLQTKAVARSQYLPAAVMGVFLCGVQISIVRSAVYEDPWLFFAIGGTAYAPGNVASIWVFDLMARSVYLSAGGTISGAARRGVAGGSAKRGTVASPDFLTNGWT